MFAVSLDVIIIICQRRVPVTSHDCDRGRMIEIKWILEVYGFIRSTNVHLYLGGTAVPTDPISALVVSVSVVLVWSAYFVPT